MKDFIYNTPTKIYFGRDKENELLSILKEYNAKRILLHYGKNSIIKSGLYNKIINILKDSDIKIFELPGVMPNPKLSLVKKGVSICKENNIDFILAVGGGSVIDSAKSIAVGALADFDPWLFQIKAKKPKKALPIGVILTIAAAGSEMSNSCVITNDKTKEKRGFNNELNRVKFAIMNPMLTFSVSKYQTACGIVDIMMHTLERFFADPNENANLTDNIAIALLKEVIKAGRIAINNPNDYDARATLMWASSLSHNGLTSCGKEFQMSVHQLEHEVSGMFDNVAHGAGLAVIWPAFALRAFKSDLKHFKRFAHEVMEITPTDSLESDILASIYKLKEFYSEIGMPTSFKELEINEDDIKQLALNYSQNKTRVIHDIIDVDYNEALNILMLAK